jgi:hypothetical protein
MLVAPAVASDDVYGLGYCAPPVIPACVDAEATYRSTTASGDCEIEIQRFTRDLFAYRDCLAHETERAVLQTNHAIDRFKCGVQAKRKCSQAETER